MTIYKSIFTTGATKYRKTIYRYTHNKFGIEQAHRYDTFLADAFASLAKNPKRIGSKIRPEIGEGVRSFRLAIAGNARGQTRAGHVIVYFEHTGLTVVISRILHESMELQRHVHDRPSTYEQDRDDEKSR